MKKISLDFTKQYEKFSKKYLDFIFSTHKETHMYGGIGNGKSRALIVRMIMLCMQYKTTALLGRLTYREIMDTTLDQFFEYCDEYCPDIYEYKKSDNVIEFISGTKCLVRAFDKDKKALSLNLGIVFLDQAEELDESTYITLLGRLRHPTGPRLMTTVGNPENNWAKTRIKENKDDDVLLVEATTQENPFLEQDYLDTLTRTFPKHYLKRFYYGSWDSFEGQVLTEYIPSKHFIDPFKIPPSWESNAEFVIDYGWRNPTVIIKIVRDYDGNHYAVDEHYESEKLVTHHRVKAYEMGYTDKHVAYIDPSCKAKNRVKDQTQISIIDEFTDKDYPYPVYPVPANNDIAGLNRLNQWFRDGTFFIFKTCPNLDREVRGLRWKTVRPDHTDNMPEKVQDKDDHGTDCLKYYCNSRPPDVPLPTDKLNPLRTRREKLTKGTNIRVY